MTEPTKTAASPRRRFALWQGAAALSTLALVPLATGAMAFGELLWMEGQACGLASPVIAEDGDELMLAETPPVMPALPVRVRLTEGCDRRLATCRDRFGNAVNFRGEAHLPGNDLLTRYPGG